MLQRLAILLMMVCCEVSAKEFSQADHEWWAFQPVVKPAVLPAGQGWAINEIDHFVAHKLKAQNLSPAGSADTYLPVEFRPDRAAAHAGAGFGVFVGLCAGRL